MGVWICKAHATCSDCGKEYNANNAMGLMAKHCKKEGHDGEVTMCYAIHYAKSEKEVGGKGK